MFDIPLRTALETAQRAASAYEAWRIRRRYRPERHYMRGERRTATVRVAR